MSALHGFTSHFKPQFSIFFRHPSPMSPTLSELPDIAPKAQRPLSRRAPGAIGTPVLVESCFNRRFLWKSAGSWWNGLNTPEIYRLNPMNTEKLGLQMWFFHLVSVFWWWLSTSVHPSPLAPHEEVRPENYESQTTIMVPTKKHQKTRWQKVSCKNRWIIPKCYITSMEKSTIQIISWLLRHSKLCRAHHFPRQLQHLSKMLVGCNIREPNCQHPRGAWMMQSQVLWKF